MMGPHERRCQSKRRYRCHADAAAALEALRDKFGRDAVDVQPYRCPWCHGHHLGRPLSIESMQDLADELRRRQGYGR